MFTFSNFQFIPNCQNLWHLKNQLFLLLHTACYLTCVTSIALTIHVRHAHCLVCNEMYHNVFRYEYLTFQTQIYLHKQYIFDTNIIQSEYALLFPFSIYWPFPDQAEE